MKINKFSGKLLKYEIVNATSNMFTLIFGVAFPLFMSMLFSFMFSGDLPESETAILNASLYIVMIMIVPLATMFIGYAANYSQEIENGSLQRFKLFGYKESTLLAAKLLANLIFLTGALIIYTAVIFLVLDIAPTTFLRFITLIIYLYIIAAILLVLSHAIAAIMRRFATTYGITMALYFTFMTLGGMMGFSPSLFPTFLQYICKALPMYYISENFLDFWLGGSFNFLPLILSCLGLAALSVGLLIFSIFLNKKGNRKRKKYTGVDWE